MREILFKAKHITINKWYEGYYVKMERLHYICVLDEGFENGYRLVEINPETLCQYTGVTDKHGMKIWENDICSAKLVGEEEKENCIIRYGRRAENFKYELGFNLEWTKTNYLRCDICYWTENEYIEVVGNIFDNPELVGE